MPAPKHEWKTAPVDLTDWFGESESTGKSRPTAATAEAANNATAPGKNRKPQCLHCKARVSNRPRGLCKVCHGDHSIRTLYPRRRPGVAAESTALATAAPCPICSSRPGAWRKGLCRPCYESGHGKGVRSPWKMGQQLRKERDGERPPRRPKKPTAAEPGSEEKILVMIARRERGENLHHPKDFRRDLQKPPL